MSQAAEYAKRIDQAMIDRHNGKLTCDKIVDSSKRVLKGEHRAL